jgi:diguanylate cyclase (GGDEF)-like protein
MRWRHERRSETTYSDVVAELTEMALRGLVPTVVISVIGMAGGTAAVAYCYHDPVMWAGAGSIALFGCIRVAIVLKLEKSAAYRRRFLANKPLRRFFYLNQLLYFTLMAANTLWNFHCHRPAAETLCTLGIFMFCNGINGRIGANPWNAKLLGVVMLSVLAFCLWGSGNGLSWVVELNVTLFAVIHCRSVQEKFDIVAEQIRMQRKLRLLAERDPLTSLTNRRGFEAALNALCQVNTAFAILYIDLDGFKPVNDRFGHASGDELLRQVADRLVAVVRTKDVVARLGGDEFAILQLPVTQRRNAEALAQRILSTLSRPFEVDDHPVVIGASIGICIPPGGQADSAQLLKQADDALYQAKQAGKGRYVYAETNSPNQAHQPLIAV